MLDFVRNLAYVQGWLRRPYQVIYKVEFLNMGCMTFRRGADYSITTDSTGLHVWLCFCSHINTMLLRKNTEQEYGFCPSEWVYRCHLQLWKTENYKIIRHALAALVDLSFQLLRTRLKKKNNYRYWKFLILSHFQTALEVSWF